MYPKYSQTKIFINVNISTKHNTYEAQKKALDFV